MLPNDHLLAKINLDATQIRTSLILTHAKKFLIKLCQVFSTFLLVIVLLERKIGDKVYGGGHHKSNKKTRRSKFKLGTALTSQS